MTSVWNNPLAKHLNLSTEVVFHEFSAILALPLANNLGYEIENSIFERRVLKSPFTHTDGVLKKGPLLRF